MEENDGRDEPYKKFINNLAMHAAGKSDGTLKKFGSLFASLSKFETMAPNVTISNNSSNQIDKLDNNKQEQINVKPSFFVVTHPKNLIEINPEIKNYVEAFTCDIEKFNYVNQIKDALNKAKSYSAADEKITIMIDAHSMIIGGEHYMGYVDPRCDKKNKASISCLISSKDFLQEIANIFPQSKLEIILLTCYSGMVQKYLDVLPKGSQLYTFATEEVAQASAPIRYAFKNYPEGKEFDVKEYIKFLLDSRYSNDHYCSTYEEQLNILIPEWVSLGISGEGAFTYKFNPYNFKDFTSKIIPAIKELKSKNTHDESLATFLNSFEMLLKFLILREKHIKIGLEPINSEEGGLIEGNSTLNRIALLLNEKVPFKPITAKFATDEVEATIALSANYIDTILYKDFDKEEFDLEKTNKYESIFDLLQYRVLNNKYTNEEAYKRTINDAIEEIEDLAKILDGADDKKPIKGDIKNLKIALSFTKDHTDQRYLSLGLMRKDDARDKIKSFYIKITEKEIIELLAGEYTSLFEFCYRKVERILEERYKCQETLIDKINKGELNYSNSKIKSLKGEFEELSHKEEILKLIKSDNKATLLFKKFDLCLKKIQKYNASANDNIKDDRDLLLKHSKYISSEEYEVVTRLVKFSGSILQYNPSEEDFIEIPALQPIINEISTAGAVLENSELNIA
jgi:hypothetical protein